MTDAFFAKNWQGIRSVGLARGAYHYANPCNSGIADATHFVDVVQAQVMILCCAATCSAIGCIRLRFDFCRYTL
jgi:GH25 family lysozyme M1 (1,4-beta-N-acetylmuramidase)